MVALISGSTSGFYSEDGGTTWNALATLPALAGPDLAAILPPVVSSFGATGATGSVGATGSPGGATGATGSVGATGAFAGTLTQNLDAAGFAFYDFDNGHSSWVQITTGAATTILAVDVKAAGYTLTASHKFVVSVGVRIAMYQDSLKTTCGYMDITVVMYWTTDGSSVVTTAFPTGITVVPDLSQLGTNLAGATCSITAGTAGGFTITATRPAANTYWALARWWVNRFEDMGT